MAIAFYTLFERKILSLSQIRVGPNKVVLYGVLQPIFDGIKLIFKEIPLPDKSKK
jgi:NADH:ubiquinone oxidoreductase subunit H